MWNPSSIHWVTLLYRLYDTGLSSCVSPVCERRADHHLHSPWTQTYIYNIIHSYCSLCFFPFSHTIFVSLPRLQLFPMERDGSQHGALATQILGFHCLALNRSRAGNTYLWQSPTRWHHYWKNPKTPFWPEINMNKSSYSHKDWKSMEADLVRRFIQSS